MPARNLSKIFRSQSIAVVGATDKAVRLSYCVLRNLLGARLAIRPYPAELVREAQLKDGTPVLLRPIKPEDEPCWHEMLAGCSPESIRSRFRCMFKEMSHEMATRFCFIDYERELAIVAEIETEGKRPFIGVSWLVCDADHIDAEFAVLVTDRWQGYGLGSVLTRYCVDIAADWGLACVKGETERHNHRMIATFERVGFELDYDTDPDVVMAHKNLAARLPHACPLAPR